MNPTQLQTGRGDRLHGQLWSKPDAQGVVVVVHGLGEHCLRYEWLADQLSNHGWALFGFDLAGHGKSPGRLGTAGSFDAIIDDVTAARETIARALPEVPQVLLGHSMGGNLAINQVLRDPSDRASTGLLAGLILCSPMLLPPSPPPRPLIFAAWLTGRLCPWIKIRRPINVEALTNDPVQIESIKKDPLLHSQINLHLATQLLSQGRWALDHARDVKVPTLIMHGDQDTMIDQSVCEHLAIRLGDHARHLIWPGQRHCLFEDTDRLDVANELVGWLRQFVRNQ